MLGARSVHTSPAACVRARSQDGVGLARSVSRLPDAAAQLVPDLGRERWDSMVRVKYFYAVIENIFTYTPFLPRFCSSTSSSPVVMARSIQPRWVSGLSGAWSRFPWMIILNTLQDWSDCSDAQTTPALNRLLFVKIHHRGIQLQPVQQMRRVGWWIFLYEAISIWAECVRLMYGHEEKVWGPGEGHQPCLSCLGGYWGRPSLDCGVLSC